MPKSALSRVAGVFAPALAEAAIEYTRASYTGLAPIAGYWAAVAFLKKLAEKYHELIKDEAAAPPAPDLTEADIKRILADNNVPEKNRQELTDAAWAFFKFSQDYPDSPAHSFLFYAHRLQLFSREIRDAIAEDLRRELQDQERRFDYRHYETLERFDDLTGASARIENLLVELTESLRPKDNRKIKFELDYLAYVHQHYGMMDFYGIASIVRDLKQKIDVAYVSLALKGGAKDQGRQPAEKVLLDHPLLTIEGLAGSGKSTLMRFVAFRCSCLEPGNRWAGLIPLLIPLRDLKDGPLTIENILNHSGIAEMTGPGKEWLDDVISAKRAVLLLDGIDELALDDRKKFWRSLARLTHSPAWQGNRFIITSRPLALRFGKEARDPEQWDPPEGFVLVEVDRLTDDEVAELIDRWFKALIIGLPDQKEKDKAEGLRKELRENLFEEKNRRVRELCEVPLLAGMICALYHFQRDLPNSRIELYRRCTDLMIFERDKVRGLPPIEAHLAAISAENIRELLRDLAYYMMRNPGRKGRASHRIEIEQERVLQLIEKHPVCATRNGGCGDPAGVLKLLIERVGLIHEPIKHKTVEFVHRTFQEYFAAENVVWKQEEDFLVSHAHNDLWRETILLSAGVKTGGKNFAPNLIKGLLDRAKDEDNPAAKKVCLALAVGCLETGRTTISPALTNRVLAKIPQIIPPASTEEAQILATAGDQLVAHLASNPKYDKTTRAACAMALARIGTNQARTLLLADYARDDQESVLIEVMKCPGIHPLDIPRVREKILPSEIPSKYYMQDVFSGPFLKHLSPLAQETKAENINLSGCTAFDGENELEHLSCLKNLRKLSLFNCSQINDAGLSHLAGLTGLQSLNLSRTKITDAGLSYLADLTLLQSLNLWRTQITDAGLSHLAGLTLLQRLDLSRTQITDAGLSHLAGLPGLQSLNLIDTQITDAGLSHLAGLTGLQSLDLMETQITDAGLSYLADLTLLQSLNLSGTQITDAGLPRLSGLTGLQSLDLNWTQITDAGLSHLAGLTGLQSLDLSGTKITDAGLPRLAGLTGLQSLNLSGTKITDAGLSDLAGLTGLQSLDLSRTQITDAGLSHLAGLTGLQSLNIWGTQITGAGLSHLAGLTGLQSLNLSRTKITNEGLARLAGLTGLRDLYLIQCKNITKDAVERLFDPSKIKVFI